jgi:hypothetical protein
MSRRLIPLIAVVPLGVLIGFLAASQNWSSATRLLVTGGVAIVVILISAPFALLRRRAPAPQVVPVTGRAHIAAYELRGVFSENPVSPLGEERPNELASGLRSSASALLPVVPRGWEYRSPTEEAVERTLFIRGETKDEDARSRKVIPDDLALRPSQPRKRALLSTARRAYLRVRSVERIHGDRTLDIPNPSPTPAHHTTSPSLDPATA